MFLTDVHGRKFLTGTDSHQNTWKQFEIDYHNETIVNRCIECGRLLEFGWKNVMEETVCDTEVDYEGVRTYFFPEEIEKATAILTDKLQLWLD